MTTENHAPQNNKSTLVVPPQNELIRLLKLVDLGYIDAIEKQIKLLEELDSQYIAFTQQVRQYTLSFQLYKLEKLIVELFKNVK
ncbi:MAG: hypothetical protein QNJ53_11000 [Pleurocapsa sp. MO_192.B19]|nr:hypothetical protein [Pleurocapsa sp. MO_192.B19]